jgi:hypothetical protein
MLELNLLLLAGLLFWFWTHHASARDKARHSARKMAEKQGVLFLDDSVALKELKPHWNGKQLQWHRRWSFEFSLDGAQRYPGHVLMDGRRISEVRFLYPDHMEQINP